MTASEGSDPELGGHRANARTPDSWLIAAVLRDPPDDRALDVLAARHWKPLYARCRVLTLDREAALDLAQETWVRVLRTRERLDPDGNLPAYLATIATNLWRDWSRSARRHGDVSESRMASLDAQVNASDVDAPLLAEVLPDPSQLGAEDATLLQIDMDRAMANLSPRHREVLVSRFLDGESSADIGRRLGRTEQTITAWVRQAIRELQHHLVESPQVSRTRGAP